jgi:NAD(P)-dependent dehydrogenase (short-subunit alcohol dehydrogenase family)
MERVVLVTGAGSGIGAATARQLAGPGTALLLHTRSNVEGLEAVAAEARAAGAEVETALGDLVEPEGAGRLTARARAAWGQLDQIVSNAGFARKGAFGSLDPAELEGSLEAMPVAFQRLVEAALPDLLASSWGRVVVVSSFVAHRFGTGGLHFPATGAAKAALEALARSLAAQVAPRGVTVNCVAPGFTRKDPRGHAATSPEAMERTRALIPTGRLCEPADIAAAIAFLLSREARQITGQVLHVDGGLSLA